MNSHFSFTRSSADQCELDSKYNESSAPFSYATDAAVIESKESCFLGSSPFMHNPFKSIPTEVIDIESDLRGQTRNLGRCPSQKFNPDASKPYDFKWKECKDERLVPEYTRTDRPCNILSGVSINRFQPLADDHQELAKIHNNSYIGTNTRILIKDAYKNQNTLNLI